MTPLQQLHEEIHTCRRCADAGHAITIGPIFSPGNEKRRVMLIGQAPGITEVEARRPFNAGSGRRLFQWLGDAGWDEMEFRGRHTMTAVTKCYPGKSGNGKGDRVPSKTEQALCRPFLEREIALVNPQLILLIGGLAIKLFYSNNARLEEIIGTAAYFPPEALTNPVNFDLGQAELFDHFDETKEGRGRWIVPLPHPSGASLWPNKPENQLLIQKAITLLNDLRLAFDL